MSTRQPPRKPKNSGTPAADALVPPQASAPEAASSAEERLAYSVDEAARLTGLSRDLLYDEMRREHLDYIKVGRRRLITRWHLEQFLQIRPGPQPPAAGITASGHKEHHGAS